jgi:hypothetical protein
MLGGVILDRVDSISVLGVIMDSRMYLLDHFNITVSKALAMRGL